MMSKKIIPFLFLLLCAMYSCQEVVTINLSSIPAKVVVDGSITNRPGPYTIRLSTSTNYFNASTFNGLSGARVAISDNAGNTDTLSESAPGIYLTHTLAGTIGRRYYLYIAAAGKTYTATALLSDTVAIDSLSYTLRPPRPGSAGSSTYSLTCSFTDPPIAGNYYGFRIYQNNVLKNDIIDNRIVSDKFINGNAQHARLRNGDLSSGDSVRVDLISFEKSAYDYYNGLRQALNAGSPFSAPPANPPSNLSAGGAGYFGAYAISSRSLQLH